MNELGKATDYIKELEKKIAELEKDNKFQADVMCDMGQVVMENIKLEKQLNEALEVLMFYADKENWGGEPFNPTLWDEGQIDLGERARKYISKLGGNCDL